MRLAPFVLALLIAVVPAANAWAQSAAGAAKRAAAAKPRHQVVFQVSDADPKKWQLALNNIRNLQTDLGRANVEIELVAYGPGIAMLKGDSEAAGGVGAALESGVNVLACENTMANQKLDRADMLRGIGYVPAGVTALVQRQREGWAYIRP